MPDQLWTSTVKKRLQLTQFVGGPTWKDLLQVYNRDFVKMLKLLAKEKEFSVVWYDALTCWKKFITWI